MKQKYHRTGRLGRLMVLFVLFWTSHLIVPDTAFETEVVVSTLCRSRGTLNPLTNQVGPTLTARININASGSIVLPYLNVSTNIHGVMTAS